VAQRAYDLLVRARGNTSDADRAMRKLQSNVKKTGRAISSVGRGMTLGLTLPILAFGKLAADEMVEAQKANAQTAAVLKSTGGVANVSAKHVNKLATSLLDLTGIDDQVVQGAENMLLTFTNVRNEVGKGNKIFDRATVTALDMSTALGVDAPKAAMMLGKALNDPARGITALRRVGVTFTDQQTKQIKEMVKSGKTMQAQKMILRELNREFGGSAAAAGKTWPAQWARFREQLAGLGAELLRTLMPTFEKLVGHLSKATEWFGKLSPRTKELAAIGLVLGAALGPVLMILGPMVTASAALLPLLAGISAPMIAVGVGAVAAAAGLFILYQRSETARGAMKLLMKFIWNTNVFILFGRAVNKVAQHFGGWKVSFLEVEKALMSFIARALGALARVMDGLAQMPGPMQKHFRAAAESMRTDAANLRIRIAGINTELDGIKSKSPKSMKAFSAAIKGPMSEAKTFADSIAVATRLWDQWNPKPKKLSITAQVRGGTGPASVANDIFKPGNNFGVRGQTRSGRKLDKNGLPSLVNALGMFTGSTAGSGFLADLLAFAGLQGSPSKAFLQQRVGLNTSILNTLQGNYNALPAKQAEARQLARQIAQLERRYRSAKRASAKRALRRQIAAKGRQLARVQAQIERMGGTREAIADQMLSVASQIVSDQDAIDDPDAGGTVGGGLATGTLDAAFQSIVRDGSFTGTLTQRGTLSQAQAAAAGISSGGVIVQQFFSGEPNMFAAAQSAQFQFATAGMA
jgi:hypothetical protein